VITQCKSAFDLQ